MLMTVLPDSGVGTPLFFSNLAGKKPNSGDILIAVSLSSLTISSGKIAELCFIKI
jgi:hypothetical protein